MHLALDFMREEKETMEYGDVYSKGRRKIQVAARSLLCYWAVGELGLQPPN
jgi:hypothetical protein